MISLSDKIGTVKGIGPKYQELLSKLNINKVQDLIYHFPFRYEDRTRIYKISELTPNDEHTIIGVITKLNNLFTRNGFRITKATIKDISGEADLVWFNQHFISKTIKVGNKLLVSGKIDQDNKRPTFNSPEWELIGTDDSEQQHMGLIPRYNTTDGVTSKWISKKIQEILSIVEIDDLLPASIREQYFLIHLDDALRRIHTPKDFDEFNKSKYRLSFDELLWLHLRGIKIRTDWNNKNTGHKITLPEEAYKSFKNNLGFELTKGQENSIQEILKDLSDTIPMNRLLQGDVGSGKTAVAEAAILATLLSGFSALLIAPTQVLAKQHYEKMHKTLAVLGFDTDLLTSNVKIQKRELDKQQLIIATHSILHHLDEYKNIGLIIIDEQHKFGVAQRSKIIDHYTDQNVVPNLLTMTATPIPRSLALTFYGDLDLSVIGELPKGRKPTITKVIQEKDRREVYKEIDTLIAEKNQLFVVCPFIQESQVDTLKTVKAAEAEFEKFKKIFSNRKVELLHGRIKNKDEILSNFVKGNSDILITTPVIEVGVDIPNANMILIETPERFGLASLHQLRGRVGRRQKQGFCYLMASENIPEGLNRLKNLEKISDGNKLAEIDLKVRGPGNMYGVEQHGYMHLSLADITDVEMVKKTKDAATNIFENRHKYPILFNALSEMIYIDDQ